MPSIIQQLIKGEIMSSKYLLLNPLTAKSLYMPLEMIIDVAIRGGMQVEHSLSVKGETCIYITSDNLEKLAEFCDKNDLEGAVVEYVGFYNMQISIV